MKITFSGDLYVETPITNMKIDKSVESIFNESDFNFVCFEGPYCPNQKNKYNKIGPNLKQDKSVAELLKYFSHASLANNHSMDYGKSGCDETIEFLNSSFVKQVGYATEYPLMYEPVVLMKDGIKVAVFCWSESQYGCCRTELETVGYGWMLNPICYSLIQKYKQDVDYVILYLHAGLEDVDTPIIDWRLIYRNFIDFGADLVVASHPHIIQGKEIYKGKSIFYSLGNFFFNGIYAQNNDSFKNSIVLKCNIDANGIHSVPFFINFDNKRINKSLHFIEENFEYLCEMLSEVNYESYYKRQQQIIDDSWLSEYQQSLSYPIWKEKGNVPFYKLMVNKFLSGYVHRCFLKPVTLNVIYHNFITDTNRFVISRYTSNQEHTY